MEKSNGKFLFNVVTVLLVLLALVVFALRNKAVVTVDFVFTKVDLSLALLICISAVLGAVIVGGIMAIRSFGSFNRSKKQDKLLKERDREIDDLKAKLSLIQSERRTEERETKF